MKNLQRGSVDLGHLAVLLAVGAAACGVSARAQDANRRNEFYPGNLVISRSVYDNKASNVKIGEVLPPNCTSTTGGCAAGTGAPFNGRYPFVFNNDIYDGSFGITSRIYLDQLTEFGQPVNTIEVPNSLKDGITKTSNQLVTSFSSKSEVALHLSTDKRKLSFMGYVAPVNALDVSNSNTPDAVDPTNPVGESYYRAVATVDRLGKFTFTETNAYSGNNGRAAILNNSDGEDVFYTAGNAGNGANPQPVNVILGAGAQLIKAEHEREYLQSPGLPTPVASFNVTELGDKADKIGKDDNFRGMTVFNNVLYYTKGSGGNGVNTVYFVDTTGHACPNGVGIPEAGAKLPTKPLSYDAATVQTTGPPNNMCILAGFPSTSNKTATVTAYPFGLWFADATTLYVADEGDGYTGGSDLYTHAAAQKTAGLQKWMFDKSSKTWKLAYTMQNGLKLGHAYLVSGYPYGVNSATSLPWAPATDGLRNITGRVYGDEVVAIWAVTSTVSGNGDTGADPNKVVVGVDLLKNTDQVLADYEPFFEFKDAGVGEVLRGVSFTPGTGIAEESGW